MSGRPAHRLPGALLAAFALAALVELVSVAVDARTGQLLAKPLLMPLLAAYVAARGGPRLLVAALLLGWGGDVFLLSSADGAFLAGMGCFAAGHLCYLVLFGRRRTRAGLALGYGLALVVALALLWSGLPAELRAPVAVYSLLLAAMACRASALSPSPGRAARSSCSPTRSSPPASPTGRSRRRPICGSCSCTSRRRPC